MSFMHDLGSLESPKRFLYVKCLWLSDANSEEPETCSESSDVNKPMYSSSLILYAYVSALLCSCATQCIFHWVPGQGMLWSRVYVTIRFWFTEPGPGHVLVRLLCIIHRVPRTCGPGHVIYVWLWYDDTRMVARMAHDYYSPRPAVEGRDTLCIHDSEMHDFIYRVP